MSARPMSIPQARALGMALELSTLLGDLNDRPEHGARSTVGAARRDGRFCHGWWWRRREQVPRVVQGASREALAPMG